MDDIHALRERAKELRCLYSIDAIVGDRDQTPAHAFLRVLEAIPAGWQRPHSTGARITYLGRGFVGPGFSSWAPQLSEPIRIWHTEVGRLDVSDHEAPDVAPFLPEEEELLRRIAGRLGEYLEWKHTELFGDRTPPSSGHWRWRQRFAEALADGIDASRFGIERLYIGGSTARGEAASGSDIDLYVLCRGSQEQRGALGLWLEGWSACLAEVALQQTGHPFPGGILNVVWLSEEPDLRRRHDLQELALRHGPAR